ncbi:MAG: polyhydroxyalkanoate synthesis regulator [Deltaproteobacteria bacterium]|nr:polyhydroxyalkanoate synthesis regulator [Deltaproteobacteria bacterium]
MDDLLKKTISFGLGVFDYTKEKVENLVEEMVKRGELSRQESSQAVEELWERVEKEQADFWSKIKEFIQGMVDEMSLARRTELKELEERVAALEKRLQD